MDWELLCCGLVMPLVTLESPLKPMLNVKGVVVGLVPYAFAATRLLAWFGYPYAGSS